MQNRTPVAADARPAVPDFTPVPRQYRHDGWTPERQRAFIEALADTGSVSRAAAMVNMAQANCYTLRRAPGAEEFRRAWEAALDFGVQRLKDIAFERAIDGQLVPVFVGGKLMGFNRKRNDALLMFCLRHYGQDASGKRTTIQYFSSRAEASASAAVGDGAPVGAGQAGGAVAQASTTTVRTVITGDAADQADPADTMAAFAGVALDGEAHAAIADALAACAARKRALDAVIAEGGDTADAALADDPDEDFIRVGLQAHPYHGTLESGVTIEEDDLSRPYEPHWTLTGADMPDFVARTMLGVEADGGVGALAAPAVNGVASVKPRRSRSTRVPPA
ncbi:hypothetical protein [Sphingomonas bacterium]|uniref:hypothetical protein n=1 Tax=Sphingomonas bacterium TaxID=1895847 RepID=UPI00157613BB|nr:hypothetical protein [Sphingomonas bacterium]